MIYGLTSRITWGILRHPCFDLPPRQGTQSTCPPKWLTYSALRVVRKVPDTVVHKKAKPVIAVSGVQHSWIPTLTCAGPGLGLLKLSGQSVIVYSTVYTLLTEIKGKKITINWLCFFFFWEYSMSAFFAVFIVVLKFALRLIFRFCVWHYLQLLSISCNKWMHENFTRRKGEDFLSHKPGEVFRRGAGRKGSQWWFTWKTFFGKVFFSPFKGWT